MLQLASSSTLAALSRCAVVALACACSARSDSAGAETAATRAASTASAAAAAASPAKPGVRALAAERPSQALWGNAVNAIGTASYQQLAAPLAGRDPGAVTWYRDGGELRLGFMRRGGEDGPEQIFTMQRQGDGWSSPLAAELPAFRVHLLSGIVTLGNGHPLLLAVGDDTDYEQVVGRSPDGTRAAISDEELTFLQSQNRRLFASFSIGDRWAKPMPVPGSLGVMFAALAAGPGQRAYALFARDDDSSYATTADRDLYLSVFDGKTWSDPLRLTQDSGREISLELRFLGEELIAVWVRDGDAELDTTGDRMVYAAAFSADGALLRPPAPLSSQLYDRPRPMLGALAGQPVLLFAGNPLPDRPAARPLLESRLGATWSEPAPTGLLAGNIARGALLPTGDATVLVYEADDHLIAAVSRGGAWHSSGAIQDFAASKFRVGEAVYQLDDQGQLVIAAVGAERLVEQAGVATLLHTRVPLRLDLALGEVLTKPRHLVLGEPVTVKVPVENRGYLYSGPFSLSVSVDGQVLASAQEADGLYPGERRTLELSLPLTRPQLPVVLEVATTAPSPELDSANNRKELAISILPDFVAASVTRAGDRITAVVREAKGVAAAPVNVDFVLIEDGVETPLAQRQFDPGVAVPLTVDVPGLAARTAPYSIAVRVNDRSGVVEDDHGNNLTTYAFKPSADFVVAQLEVGANEVTAVIENRGERPVSEVALLFTTSAELAVSPSPLPDVPPLALTTVALVDGRGTVQLPRAVLDGQPGYFLYAVANPYGAVPERERDNNSRQVARAVVTPPPPALPRPAVYAQHRITLAAGAVVLGDVAVRDAAGAEPSLDVASSARVEGAVRADRVHVANGGSLRGALTFNALDAEPGAIVTGPTSTPLALPVLSTIPTSPAAQPGATKVTVARGTVRILPPGAYGEVCVGCGGSASALAHLILPGGTYDLRSLKLAGNTRLTCFATCELRVAGEVTSSGAAALGPMPGSQLPADQVRVVAGGSVSLAAGSTVVADVIAAGAIQLLGNARVTGRLAGSQLSLGAGSLVTGSPATSSAATAVATPLDVTVRSETLVPAPPRRQAPRTLSPSSPSHRP